MKENISKSNAATSTTTAVEMNTVTHNESVKCDWRDYEWRRIVRFDWSNGDVDIKGYVYETYQEALNDVRCVLCKLNNKFEEMGYEVADVLFNVDKGIGQLTLAEGSVISEWIESNKLPW